MKKRNSQLQESSEQNQELIDAQEEQNKMLADLFQKLTAEQQATLKKLGLNLNKQDTAQLAGQRAQLTIGQMMNRRRIVNQRSRGRAVGVQLNQRSLSLQNQRLREQQRNIGEAVNVATREKAEDSRNDLLAQLLRR